MTQQEKTHCLKLDVDTSAVDKKIDYLHRRLDALNKKIDQTLKRIEKLPKGDLDK